MEVMNSPSIESLAGKLAARSDFVDRALFAAGEEVEGGE